MACIDPRLRDHLSAVVLQSQMRVSELISGIAEIEADRDGATAVDERIILRRNNRCSVNTRLIGNQGVVERLDRHFAKRARQGQILTRRHIQPEPPTIDSACLVKIVQCLGGHYTGLRGKWQANRQLSAARQACSARRLSRQHFSQRAVFDN